MKGRRRAHLRHYQSGKITRVREHAFESGAAGREFKLTWVHGEARINGSQTYQIKCVHCGLLVYFYRNDAGSRVFFEHLGKPWPKHECAERSSKMQSVDFRLARAVRKTQPVEPETPQNTKNRKQAKTRVVVRGSAKFQSERDTRSKKAKAAILAEAIRQENLRVNREKWEAEGKPFKDTETKFELSVVKKKFSKDAKKS